MLFLSVLDLERARRAVGVAVCHFLLDRGG